MPKEGNGAPSRPDAAKPGGALQLGSRLRPLKDIPSQPYEDELIVVTPSDSTMHTLSGVGPWIWSRLEGRTLQSVATELVEAFEVSPETAAKDVLNFASVLLGRGLVEIVPPDPDPVSS